MHLDNKPSIWEVIKDSIEKDIYSLLIHPILKH